MMKDKWVFVKLQPYRQHSVVLRKHQKLGLRYFGPFQIVKRIGDVAYQLALLAEAKIHPVFHVSLLKKCEGDPGDLANYIPIPLQSIGEGREMHGRVMQQRTILKKDKLVQQVLIQWREDDETDYSWEDVDNIRSSFPAINLEDKVEVNGGSNVVFAEAEEPLIWLKQGHVLERVKGAEVGEGG